MMSLEFLRPSEGLSSFSDNIRTCKPTARAMAEFERSTRLKDTTENARLSQDAWRYESENAYATMYLNQARDWQLATARHQYPVIVFSR
jgi:hypothetical protein